jgi:hypothetical protein
VTSSQSDAGSGTACFPQREFLEPERVEPSAGDRGTTSALRNLVRIVASAFSDGIASNSVTQRRGLGDSKQDRRVTAFRALGDRLWPISFPPDQSDPGTTPRAQTQIINPTNSVAHQLQFPDHPPSACRETGTLSLDDRPLRPLLRDDRNHRSRRSADHGSVNRRRDGKVRRRRGARRQSLRQAARCMGVICSSESPSRSFARSRS